jgi:hypothetical protein
LRKIAHVDVSDGKLDHRISLYAGDLAAIPRTHSVDILAISAFPNDYVPTPGSVIGALDRAGLSISSIAIDKEYDLRDYCSFWLSKPLSGADRRFNFRRIACFEHGPLGAPPAIVGDFFRGLFPFVGTPHDSVVAMSLFAAGDARFPPEQMFDVLVQASASWMSRGLAISELMIVVRDRNLAASLASRIEAAASKATAPTVPIAPAHDVFLSFSSNDQDAADVAKAALIERGDVNSVFDYRSGIDRGVCWQSKIDAAITSCHSVLAILSPEYLRSPECQEELHQARLRHKREGGGVLFPLYWKKLDGEISLWLQLINSVECREANRNKLAEEIRRLHLKLPK